MEAIQALWSACCERQRDLGRDRTHLVGRAAEDFVTHLVCPACAGFHWKSYAGNHPAYDLTCEACVPPLHFQIKAGKGLKPNAEEALQVMGTTYTKTVGAVGTVAYLLLSYETLSEIRCMYYVPVGNTTASCIQPWDATVPATLCTITFPRGSYSKIRFE